jgi:TetR/AcrR family fatty acid metabolism transcriptional regulator
MNAHDLAERLAAVRRDHILDSATRVFAAKGYNGASIRDIARAAGVADGTIYNYFANKDALLLGILDRLNETEQRERDLTRPAGADPREFVRAYVRHRFEVFERVGFDAFQVLISEVLVNPTLRARYIRDIVEPTFSTADAAIATWAPADGEQQTPNPRLLTRIQAALVLGCVVLRLCGEPLLQERWSEVPDLVADMILDSTGARHANDTTR